MSVRIVPVDQLVHVTLTGWELVKFEWFGCRSFAVVMRRGLVEVRA
jgi:hypothetical protein